MSNYHPSSHITIYYPLFQILLISFQFFSLVLLVLLFQLFLFFLAYSQLFLCSPSPSCSCYVPVCSLVLLNFAPWFYYSKFSYFSLFTIPNFTYFSLFFPDFTYFLLPSFTIPDFIILPCFSQIFPSCYYSITICFPCLLLI